jgi:hypothetical protein
MSPTCSPFTVDPVHSIETLNIPAVTALQEAYIRKVIDSVNDLDNVLYEVTNESNGATIKPPGSIT